jgi:putative heme-binding domain-containing protein
MVTAEQAKQLDEKFARYSALASKPGDLDRGKTAATVCRACHLMGTEGGQIGPNLSGVGAMGTEAILRNILTPNAAMESAYRIYRVEERDGSVLDAFFVSEDKDAVVVRLPGTPDQRIPKSQIVRTQFLRRSLMPEGLLDALPPDQGQRPLRLLANPEIRSKGNSGKHRIGLVQARIALVQPRIALVQPRIALVQPGSRWYKPDRLVQPRIALVQPRIALVQPRIALVQPRIALVQPRIALVQPRIALVQPRIALVLPRIALVQPGSRWYSPGER